MNALDGPRPVYREEHLAHREMVREFVSREVVPHRVRWEQAGRVDRELFLAAGEAGLFGIAAPEEHGGAGIDDFRFNAILSECLAEADALGVGLGLPMQADIALPYFLALADSEQSARWLPGIVAGRTILALAVSEPGAGSDVAGIATRALRDGDSYVLNGTKTFITNGLNADLVVVAAKTDPSAGHRGISLLVVEADRAGFSRGPKLRKAGQPAADTAELFFDDVRVPATHLLGEENRGFYAMMTGLPKERASIAVQAAAQAERSLRSTIEYSRQRESFGIPIGGHQAVRFALAEMTTQVHVARVYVDALLERLAAGERDPIVAAQAKWWATEQCQSVLDRCLQLHGGYGYMTETAVARAWRDSRVQTIYGGTTEVMKEIIGRGLGF
jgi:alkylation response protein AidB-like acyl-CoA dehydrogenase